MSINELQRLAQSLIAEKIARHEVVQMEWAVHELIIGRGEIAGDGAPFYNLCAREFVYLVVKKEVGKYDEEPQSSAQQELVLEGFNHLRAAYTVKRDGERLLVPTVHLTDDELIARATEYRAQAVGLQSHAQEILDYVASRHLEAAQ